MAKILNMSDTNDNFISSETRNRQINAVIAFFKEERNEEIGVIAAENLLTFFEENIGKEIYRKAVLDCKRVLKNRLDDLDVDLDALAPC